GQPSPIIVVHNITRFPSLSRNSKRNCPLRAAVTPAPASGTLDVVYKPFFAAGSHDSHHSPFQPAGIRPAPFADPPRHGGDGHRRPVRHRSVEHGLADRL